MTDLIIKGAGGIKDGLYVIKDGEMFKYKPNGGSVRSYHVTDRPRGRWIGDKCSVCGEERAWHGSNPPICPNCGADMRTTKGEK